MGEVCGREVRMRCFRKMEVVLEGLGMERVRSGTADVKRIVIRSASGSGGEAIVGCGILEPCVVARHLGGNALVEMKSRLID